ncbi:hypothetical protein ASJ35_16170 [Ruthenibacterium lactatiformans]|uniref:Uncharacterized protein n=1 Tax=Ruthenibacterium lactatiformans TaxID=1550024 RepID=A0A0W7TMA9_9FIRM|nr:hypothetical protein ASJ35_16170 [Ruthenibacterium lactatiformans]
MQQQVLKPVIMNYYQERMGHLISHTQIIKLPREFICVIVLNANTAIPHVQAGCLQMIAQVVPDFLRMEINSMCNGKGQALKSDIRKQ